MRKHSRAYLEERSHYLLRGNQSSEALQSHHVTVHRHPFPNIEFEHAICILKLYSYTRCNSSSIYICVIDLFLLVDSTLLVLETENLPISIYYVQNITNMTHTISKNGCRKYFNLIKINIVPNQAISMEHYSIHFTMNA